MCGGGGGRVLSLNKCTIPSAGSITEELALWLSQDKIGGRRGLY